MFRAVFRATRLPQAALPRAALPAQGSLSALRSRFALRPFSTESSAPLASSSDVLSASEQVLRPRVRPPSKTADDLRRILPIPPKPAPLDRRHGRDINAVPTFEEEEAAIIEYCDWAVDHKITVDMGAFGKAYQCYLRIKASGKIKQLSSFAWDRLLFVAARTYTVRNFNPIWYDLKSSLAPNPPSIYAFAIALHFWGVKRQMIPAMEACLNEMKAAGVAPNLQVYSTLIYVYAWAKDNQRMEQAFAQLISDPKIRPDTAVYNTLLTLHEPDGYKKPFFETPTFGYWQLLVQAADADPSGWIVPDERSFELLAEHLNYHLLIMETVQWAVQQLHHFSAATSPKYAGVRPSRKFYAKLFHLIYKRHAATKRVQRFAEMRNDLKRYAELLFQDMIKRGVMYDNYVLRPLKGLGIKTPLSGTHSVKVKRPSSNPRAAEELRANIPFEDEPLARALKFTFPLHGETRKSLREKEKAAQAAQQAADAAKAAQQESSAQTAGAANEKA